MNDYKLYLIKESKGIWIKDTKIHLTPFIVWYYDLNAELVDKE